jgi:hypothetical protein
MSWKTMSWKFLLGSNVEIIWLKSLQELESQVLNSAIIVKTWGHGIAKKTFQNLGFQVLKTCKISELWLPSLQKYFQMSSCLGRPSHERHNSWQGSNVEVLYPEKFQDLESQVLNSAIIVKTWGHGVKKNVTFQNLGSKSWKNVRFQNCGCQVLKNISKCVHVLEDQVMKDIIRGKGLMLKVFTRKFQDLESQVLNRAIIVKSWGHGVAKK